MTFLNASVYIGAQIQALGYQEHPKNFAMGTQKVKLIVPEGHPENSYD